MINALRIERDRIALEASVSLNLQSLLKDTFPSIVAGFAGFVGGFSPKAPAIQLTSKQSEFIRELTKHPYLDIAPLAAYTPEGLNVSYLHYLQKLTPAVLHAVQILPTLSEYATFLAVLLTNTDQKFASSPVPRKFADMEKNRQLLNHDLGVCFFKGSTRTERTMGDVVDRNNEWTAVFHQSDELVKQVNSVDRGALNKKVAECVELLEKIKTSVEKGNLEGVSSSVVVKLADGAYTVASELEFYVVTYYKVAALAESINRTVAHFKKVFEH